MMQLREVGITLIHFRQMGHSLLAVFDGGKARATCLQTQQNTSYSPHKHELFSPQP